MNHSRISGQYKKTQIETARGVDLIIICYEKAIQFLKQAKEYRLENKLESKCDRTERVIAIISELRSSLDYDKGGKIAENLDAIYSYLIGRIVEGDMNHDITAFDEGIRVLSELKHAWDEIVSEVDDQIPVTEAQNILNRGIAQIAA